MNAGTPTSAAPGVSVRGRMRSAAAASVAPCAARRGRSSPAALCARPTIASHSGDSATPASERRAPDRFAPADESTSLEIRWVASFRLRRFVYRLRLLISLTAWSQARAVRAM